MGHFEKVSLVASLQREPTAANTHFLEVQGMSAASRNTPCGHLNLLALCCLRPPKHHPKLHILRDVRVIDLYDFQAGNGTAPSRNT